MTDENKAFFAYPAKTDEVVRTIAAAVCAYNKHSNNFELIPWQSNDITGVPITSPIFDNILSSRYICADITYLNENVAFEIGYAIGKRKRCLLFRNNTLVGDKDLAAQVGIFDTLGYEEYSNSHELAQKLVT